MHVVWRVGWKGEGGWGEDKGGGSPPECNVGNGEQRTRHRPAGKEGGLQRIPLERAELIGEVHIHVFDAGRLRI